MFSEDVVEMIRDELKTAPWRQSRIQSITLSFVTTDGHHYQAHWSTQTDGDQKCCTTSILSAIRTDLREEAPDILNGNLMIVLTSASQQGQLMVSVPLYSSEEVDDDDDDSDEVDSSEEEVKAEPEEKCCGNGTCHCSSASVKGFPFSSNYNCCQMKKDPSKMGKSGDICARIKELLKSLNDFNEMFC